MIIKIKQRLPKSPYKIRTLVVLGYETAEASDAKSQSWHIIKIVHGKKATLCKHVQLAPVMPVNGMSAKEEKKVSVEVEVEEMLVSVRYNVEI